MKTRAIAPFLCLAVAFCATRRGTDAGADAGTDAGTAWSADIHAVGAAGHSGAATAVPMGTGTHVTVSLAGGSAGGEHPWHVHSGVCESNGPIVGQAAAYPVLHPDAGGNATAEAHIGVALDPGGSYYVNIHQSPSDLGTIVGCGQLVRD